MNIASRVQGLAASRSIFTTAPVVENPQTAALLAAGGLTPVAQQRTGFGIESGGGIHDARTALAMMFA